MKKICQKKSRFFLFITKLIFIAVTTAFIIQVFTLPISASILLPPRGQYIFPTTQKAIIWYDEGLETLILSPSFEGNTKDFALIIPVPNKPQVEKAFTAPFIRLEELINQTIYSPRYRDDDDIIPLGGALDIQSKKIIQKAERKIEFIEKKNVDVFAIKVIKAADKQALAQWLSENNYRFPKTESQLLTDYIKNNWYFVLAKINTQSLSSTLIEENLKSGNITPLKIVFKTDKIYFPLKLLQLTNSLFEEDIITVISFEQNNTEGFFSTPRPTYSPSFPPPPPLEPPVKGLRMRQEQIFSLTDEEAYHGDYSLKLTPGSKKIKINRYFYIPKPNKDYTLSFYIKQKNSDKTKLIARIINGNNPVKKEIKGNELSDWQRIKLTFNPQTQYVYLELTFDNPTLGGSFYLDALQLERGLTATSFNPNKGTYSNPQYDKRYYENRRINFTLYVFNKNKLETPEMFSLRLTRKIRKGLLKKIFSDKKKNKTLIDPLKTMRLTAFNGYIYPNKVVDDLYFDQKTQKLSNLDFSFLKIFLLIALLIGVDIGLVVYYSKKRNQG